MSLIAEKVNKIVLDIPTLGPKRFDPLTGLMIASLVISCIRMFQACNKTPAEAATRMQNLGFFDKMKLKSMIREKFRSNDNLSRKEMRAAVHDSMLKLAKCTTEEEIKALFDEASKS